MLTGSQGQAWGGQQPRVQWHHGAQVALSSSSHWEVILVTQVSPPPPHAGSPVWPQPGLTNVGDLYEGHPGSRVPEGSLGPQPTGPEARLHPYPPAALTPCQASPLRPLPSTSHPAPPTQHAPEAHSQGAQAKTQGQLPSTCELEKLCDTPTHPYIL